MYIYIYTVTYIYIYIYIYIFALHQPVAQPSEATLNITN